jgi:serine/threonine protein kinase
MSKKAPLTCADGALLIDGTRIAIPSFEILEEVGKGANGVVFKARDQLLNRAVAIKVWNSRGRKRAQFETAKIAALNHPLVVITHGFGQVRDHPYAVMELVPGTSGKEWLRTGPSLQDRLSVWGMYSRALRFLHSQGLVHGDPHLGNLLIFRDETGAYAPHDGGGNPTIALKLADTGTSEFWIDDGKFAEREAALIRETAERLFGKKCFEMVVPAADTLGYVAVLRVCDAVARFIAVMDQPYDHYASGLVAGAIANILVQTPFFDLDSVQEQVRASGLTDRRRVARRLNAKLFAIADFMNAPEHIGADTLDAYEKRRIAFLEDLGGA